MDIQYSALDKPQSYLLSSEFNNNMCSLLFNMRCKTVSGIKGNFPTHYADNFNCELCGEEDSQEHILKCQVINEHVPNSTNSKYSDIFGTVQQQRDVTILFTRLLKERDKLREERKAGIPVCINTGPTFTM